MFMIVGDLLNWKEVECSISAFTYRSRGNFLRHICHSLHGTHCTSHREKIHKRSKINWMFLYKEEQYSVVTYSF